MFIGLFYWEEETCQAHSKYFQRLPGFPDGMRWSERQLSEHQRRRCSLLRGNPGFSSRRAGHSRWSSYFMAVVVFDRMRHVGPPSARSRLCQPGHGRLRAARRVRNSAPISTASQPAGDCDFKAAPGYLATRPEIAADRAAIMGFLNGVVVTLDAASRFGRDAIAEGSLSYRAAIALYPECKNRSSDFGMPTQILTETDDWTLAASCNELLQRTQPDIASGQNSLSIRVLSTHLIIWEPMPTCRLSETSTAPLAMGLPSVAVMHARQSAPEMLSNFWKAAK